MSNLQLLSKHKTISFINLFLWICYFST